MSLTRLSHVPHALKQAQIDGQKPDRFYGTQKNLAKSRSQSAKQTRSRYAVMNMLKRTGIK